VWAYRNDLMDSLASVHEEGRSLDESSMFPVPLDLFDHLDGAADNNPELYRLKLIESSDDHAANLKDKIAYLDVSQCGACALIQILSLSTLCAKRVSVLPCYRSYVCAYAMLIHLFAATEDAPSDRFL